MLLIVLLSSVVCPSSTLAHGGYTHTPAEEEQAVEWIYLLLASGVLTVLSFGLYRFKFRRVKALLGLGLLFMLGSAALGMLTWADADRQAEPSFQHVYGLGYTEDGQKLWVPTQDGLHVLEAGNWKLEAADKHWYKGFSVVKGGFYSSGHPDPAAMLPDPLGVVKSTDGQSLQLLGLQGVTDFHEMGAGYHTHMLYVLNEDPNPHLTEAGLYRSADQAKTWQKSAGEGLHGTALAVAVHPTDEATVAVGTQSGLFLSRDHGEHFQQVDGSLQVTALTFSVAGDLLVGGLTPEPVLKRYDLTTQQMHGISLPELKPSDAVNHIAQHPSFETELVFATQQTDVYRTTDGGDNWAHVAEKGQKLPQ